LFHRQEVHLVFFKCDPAGLEWSVSLAPTRIKNT